MCIPSGPGARALGLVLLCAFGSGGADAQYAERPELFGSGEAAVDISGRSVKNPRVRAVHTSDPSLEGGTLYFIEKDPFLAYQLGRNLNFREFRDRDGTFAAASDQLVTGIGNLRGPMADDFTAKITGNNQVSCTGCHNQPYGNPGGGANFASTSGRGRNSPHYFGGGIVEMLAIQIRSQLLFQLDTDGNGWISAAEANSHPPDVTVTPAPGADPISFGNPNLDADGRPQLNNHLKIIYVDDQGNWQFGALGIDGVTTFGYHFQLEVFGWGEGVERRVENEQTGFDRLILGGAVNPTLRAFYWDPAFTHGGLDAHDPSTLDDPDNDGVSLPTLAGAVQFPATHQPPDTGAPVGGGPGFGFYSAGDADNDGHLTEISEGDLDLAEWFMLNAPRPGFAGTPAEYDAGVALMDSLACTVCHVETWQIEPKTRRPPPLLGEGMAKGPPGGGGGAPGTVLTAPPPGPAYAGDRRVFDFETSWNDALGRLEGRLVRLYDVQRDGTHQRRFDGFTVRGLFSDLRQHDMGAGFEELAYDASLQRDWRTAPLWGVGSGLPWGHDGASFTLRDVILRHDGEGAVSRDAFLAASASQQEDLIGFLRKLVLYDVETLPADIDGDGTISTNFVVQGMDTGAERFNAEWLFQTPVKIQGRIVNIDGVPLTSYAATNITEAYGLDLEYRADSDGDGWPDVWDPQPAVFGVKDGVTN